jgi:hypothetical protein
MPSDSSISSTTTVAFSFAGASQTVFTTRWGHGLFRVLETSGTGSRFDLVFERGFTGGHIGHQVTFHLQETGAGVDIPEDLKLRIYSHMLLNQIPDKGVAEAFEALARISEFYAAPPTHLLVTPRIEQAIPATIGRVYDRPTFPLTED